MRILVVGGGGREHALVWKLSQEAEVFCTPGNAGIARDCDCFDVKASDHAGIGALAHRLKVDLIVIGPEDPLIAGLADFLRKESFAVFGPNQNAATLEGSKAWSKRMMREAGVPTAEFERFDDAELAAEYASTRFAEGIPVVVKASGNALGKGVVVCESLDEAEDAISAMLLEREFGEAGSEIVIEDRLIGREFSLLSIVSGPNYVSLPIAQDYKRALDGDRGPNTGGMGTYSPCEWVTPETLAETEKTIVAPMVRHLHERGIDYRGVLFSGVMVTSSGPKCLEYNVRFGDPETQTVVRRLGDGFANLLFAAASGAELPPSAVLDHAAVTVILASQGYPGKSAHGHPIEIGLLPDGVEVFHSGTALKEGVITTAGGRVLGVSATGETVEAARQKAYASINQIRFEGARYRTDIGKLSP